RGGGTHDRVAGARFADDGENLIAVDVERHVLHGVSAIGAGRQIDGQVAELQDRHAYTSRSRGLRASLRPSPTRLMDRTASRMAVPGMAPSHHAERRNVRPEAIQHPQLRTIGSPSPRDGSADSMRRAVATISEPVTMIGDRQLGRISRAMMS